MMPLGLEYNVAFFYLQEVEEEEEEELVVSDCNI